MACKPWTRCSALSHVLYHFHVRHPSCHRIFFSHTLSSPHEDISEIPKNLFRDIHHDLNVIPTIDDYSELGISRVYVGVFS